MHRLARLQAARFVQRKTYAAKELKFGPSMLTRVDILPNPPVTKDISSMRFHTSSKFRSNIPVTYCDSMRLKEEAVVEHCVATFSNIHAKLDGLLSAIETNHRELMENIQEMNIGLEANHTELMDKINEMNNGLRSPMDSNHSELHVKIQEMTKGRSGEIQEITKDISGVFEEITKNILDDMDRKHKVVMGLLYCTLVSTIGLWVLIIMIP